MKRQMIKIDEDKCNGCGLCIPNCAEGALQIIDHKARLISDAFCDGLGACLGHCPKGAITIEEREAVPYDERIVMEDQIIKGGINLIKAHLKHMKDHNEIEYYNIALEVLKEQGITNPLEEEPSVITISQDTGGSCPGTRQMSFGKVSHVSAVTEQKKQPSALRQWPVQLHLLSPTAPFLQGSDLLLAADCAGFSLGGFHSDHLAGKTLAIACPKLDHGLDSYLQKLVGMIEQSNINTLTVMMMEVPCCGGLLALAKKAVNIATRKIPVKKIVVGIQGDILTEEWV